MLPGPCAKAVQRCLSRVRHASRRDQSGSRVLAKATFCDAEVLKSWLFLHAAKVGEEQSEMLIDKIWAWVGRCEQPSELGA